MSKSKLNIQLSPQTTVLDVKRKQEKTHLLNELELLKVRDEETSQFLKTTCCDTKQTAQFLHYMASVPCTSVCSTLDIPSQNKWGGWYQSSFLTFYTRSLIETLNKIKLGVDSLSLANYLLLQTELKIAQQCFQSAQERDRLEEASKKKSDALSFNNKHNQKMSNDDFRIIQKTNMDKLIKRVTNLKKGENYCHAAGFIGHAIYINFENLGDRLQVKICNLGAGLNYHPFIKGAQPQLFLPVIINFTSNKAGHKQLNGFCQSITRAITEEEDQATQLIYGSGYGTELTVKEYTEYYRSGKITAEFKQKTGNCTAKGYFHSLRERLPTLEIYENLMLSLFIWSKNLYYHRNNQIPLNPLAVVSSNDFDQLRRSEAVFKNRNNDWFWKKISKLMPGIIDTVLPQQVTSSQNAASVQPLPAYQLYRFSESHINNPAISEETLFSQLHYK